MTAKAKEHDELAAALRGVDLFADLPESSLADLASQMRVSRFADGDRVIVEDTGGSMGRMFVVLRGTARAEHDGTTVATYGPGDHFGEMSLLDGKPRSATVVATSELTAATLASWNLRAALVEEPTIALHLIEALAARLRAANEHLH
jgi:CRP/FNR family cyclic AMP-dependent transcriptional regulator